MAHKDDLVIYFAVNSMFPTRGFSWRSGFLLAACICLAAPPLSAQCPNPNCLPPAGSVDTTFFTAKQPSDGFLGAALGAREIEGGKILVNMWGTFSSGGPDPIERDVMVRLNRDGTIDPGFEFQTSDLERVWMVHAFAVSGHGMIAAASSGVGTEGFFYGHLHITRSDGTSIFSADTGIDNSRLVRCLAWQADGKLLIGGDYVEFLPGIPRGLARLLEDGRLDAGFSPPVDLADAIGVAVQPDGKILMLTPNAVHRLLSNGSPDPDFHSAHLDSFLYDANPHRPVPVALQPDGKILVCWGFSGIDGVPRPGVARLSSNGFLDSSFDAGKGPEGAFTPDMDMALQPDGKMIVAGHFTSFNGVDRSALVRLRSDGSVDLSFDSGRVLQVGRSITLLHDGSYLATDAIFSFGGSMSPYHLLGDEPIRLQFPDGCGRALRINSLIGDTYILESSLNLKTWRAVSTNSATACWLSFTNSLPGALVFFRAQKLQH